MRIAIPYENGNIPERFGKLMAVKLYELEEGKLGEGKVIKYAGEPHDLDAKAAFVHESGADKLICNKICEHCQGNIDSYGIEIFGGVSLTADEAAKALSEGRLNYEKDRSKIL